MTSDIIYDKRKRGTKFHTYLDGVEWAIRKAHGLGRVAFIALLPEGPLSLTSPKLETVRRNLWQLGDCVRADPLQFQSLNPTISLEFIRS